ncbi:MAG: hypothetical protein ABI171_00455 [Collimonas sp.]|uniref:hypothetical protein n=1 Tax=Collimonas sp. TaxID=1963772 RepID=UPI003266F1CC
MTVILLNACGSNEDLQTSLPPTPVDYSKCKALVIGGVAGSVTDHGRLAPDGHGQGAQTLSEKTTFIAINKPANAQFSAPFKGPADMDFNDLAIWNRVVSKEEVAGLLSSIKSLAALDP